MNQIFLLHAATSNQETLKSKIRLHYTGISTINKTQNVHNFNFISLLLLPTVYSITEMNLFLIASFVTAWLFGSRVNASVYVNLAQCPETKLTLPSTFAFKFAENFLNFLNIFVTFMPFYQLFSHFSSFFYPILT